MLGSGKHNRAGTRGALAYLYDARARGIFLQALAIAALCLLFYEIASNTAENLRRQNVASGFDFLGRTSGFDVSQKLISYSNTMTFGRAFWVGLLNTLLVSSLGIVLATGLGFVIGVARLSGNWLVARLSTIYIEIVRNIPLLLQLLFWYFAALKALPMPLQSTELGAGMHLNRRGLYLPWPAEPGAFNAILLGGIVAVGAVFALTSHARRRRKATGEIQSVGWISAAMLIFIPAGFQLLFGGPLAIESPKLGHFNIEGGLVIQPEFGALLIGLSVYTAAFIAEIVRAGVQGVPKGQHEAAAAVGLSRYQTLRLVIIPQAARIMIPPLTNQFLNLTKNSSLAVAIGYPDLVSVFSGTVLNLTNQAVEVILVTMGVYLALSLMTSALMNWLNGRWAIVER